MNKEQYAEYLLTPRWKKLASDCRKKAGNKCQVCNTAGQKLSAHHRSYERLHTEDEQDDLICLCEECHSKFHDKFKLEIQPEKTKRPKQIFVRMSAQMAYDLSQEVQQRLASDRGDPYSYFTHEAELMSAIVEAMAPDFNK